MSGVRSTAGMWCFFVALWQTVVHVLLGPHNGFSNEHQSVCIVLILAPNAAGLSNRINECTHAIRDVKSKDKIEEII